MARSFPVVRPVSVSLFLLLVGPCLAVGGEHGGQGFPSRLFFFPTSSVLSDASAPFSSPVFSQVNAPLEGSPETGDAVFAASDESPETRARAFVELMDAPTEERPFFSTPASASASIKIKPHGISWDRVGTSNAQPWSPLEGEAKVRAVVAPLSALQMEQVFSTVRKKDRKIIIKTLKALTRRSFQKGDNYITTYTYIGHLTRANPLFRSVARSDEEKRRLLSALSRIISHKPHRKLKKRKEELFRAMTVVRNYLRIPKVVQNTDPFLLECTAHLVEDIRQNRHEGYWSFFDGLRHDASLALYSVVAGTFLEYQGGFDSYMVDQTNIIDTCVKMSLSVGKLPFFDALQLPGGFIGSLLAVTLKGYNYMFFPAIAATTSLISVATGLICLTQLPPILFNAYDVVARSFKKGLRLGFMKYYQFRVRGDRVGQNALSFLAMNKGASLLAILWQLKNVNYGSLKDFKTIAPTTYEAFFHHGVNFGAVEFSSEIQRHLEEDYLALRPELDTCYGSARLTPLVELKCDASWQDVERFTKAMGGMLAYVSRFNFKNYVGELLLVMYTIAIVNMNVSRGDGDNSTKAGFADAKEYIDVETSTGAFPAKLFRLPFLRENAHRLSVGLSKLDLENRLEEALSLDAKSEASTEVPDSPSAAAARSGLSSPLSAPVSARGPADAPPSFLSTATEDSLGVSSLPDSADVARQVAAEMRERFTLAPDWRGADWDGPVDALSPGEQKRLVAVRKKRTRMMFLLFHQGVSSLTVATEQLFGRFVHLLMLNNAGKPLKRCPSGPALATAGVCQNDRALRARNEMPLRLLVSIFAGMFYRRAEGHFGATKEEIVDGFLAFIEDMKFSRMPTGFFAKLRKTQPQWILDVVLSPLFGEGTHNKVPIKPGEMAILKAIVVSEVGALFEQVADSARFKHSRCDTTGQVFILTDMNGGTQFFATPTPRTAELEEAACKIEFQVQETGIVFRGDLVKGGVLLLPGVPPIAGKLSKDHELQTPAEADSETLLVVEGTLWLQGYPRIHARMIGAVLYVAKRLRYPTLSWGELVQVVTPQDLEFAYRILQEGTSEKLQADLADLDKKTLYSFDFSLGNIWSILLGTLERAVLPIKKQAFLSADFNIIVGAALLLNVYNSILKNVSGLTHWYLRFENCFYSELKRAKLERRPAPAGPAFVEAGGDAGRAGPIEAGRGTETQHASLSSRLSASFSETHRSDAFFSPSESGARGTTHMQSPFSFVGNAALRAERTGQETGELEAGHAKRSGEERENPFSFSFETERVLDWNCNAFYENGEEERPITGVANISVDERNALQCSLLQFMRRQPTVSEEDAIKLRKESGKVLAYIRRIVYELRVLKGRSRSSWKSFMNAYPAQPKNPVTEIREDVGRLKAFFRRTGRKLNTRFKAWRHKLRSELGKKFFGKRALNVMRGKRFMRVLFVAFTELFPNPAEFPGQVLLTPMQMLQFCGLQTVLRTYTAPYLFDKRKGNGLALQMKASPVPSDAHRNALEELQLRLARIVHSDPTAEKLHASQLVRQVGGYLQLLAETSFTGVEVPEYTARTFVRYVKLKMNMERRGVPKTDTEFMAVLQMQVTDLSLLRAILAAFDDVEELKKIQQELTKENYNVAALSAEKLRLYSPFFYFDHSSESGESVRRSRRPASMLVLTLECRQQTLSPSWKSGGSSLEAFLLFLRENLFPEDIAEIAWSELSTAEPSASRSSPTEEAGATDPVEDGPNAEGASTEPWKIAMKLPLLTGLEILGCASEFRPDSSGNIFAVPSVLCHISEPADYVLPLGLPEWIKLRRDSSTEADLFREERREYRDEMSMFDTDASASVSTVSAPLSPPLRADQTRMNELLTSMETPSADWGSGGDGDPTATVGSDESGGFVEERAKVEPVRREKSKDETKAERRLQPGEAPPVSSAGGDTAEPSGDTRPSVQSPTDLQRPAASAGSPAGFYARNLSRGAAGDRPVPRLPSSPTLEKAERSGLSGPSPSLPETAGEGLSVEPSGDEAVEEGEDAAATAEEDGDETEPFLDGDGDDGTGSDSGLRRAYALSDEILPVFLDAFHGLYALARPWSLREPFLRRVAQFFSAAYEACLLEGEAADSGESCRKKPAGSPSASELEVLFHRVSGGQTKPSVTRNPILEVVFKELYNNVVETRKAVTNENVGKLATWVCVNSAREICAAGSLATNAPLASHEYRSCVQDIEARCREPDWQEFQVVLQAEEQAVKSGIFVSAMQSVERQNLRQILDAIDDVLADMVVDELKKHWWAPPPFSASSVPSVAGHPLSAADGEAVQQRWRSVKKRFRKCVHKLRFRQPDLASQTVRTVVESLFFKLTRGDFSSKGELKSYLQEMRFTIARAAAVELDGTMVSRTVALRHQARSRQMRRRKRKRFYHHVPRTDYDDRVLLISDSSPSASPEAREEAPEPEASLLQVRDDRLDDGSRNAGTPLAVSPVSPSLVARRAVSPVSSPSHASPVAVATTKKGRETLEPPAGANSLTEPQRTRGVSASFASLVSRQEGNDRQGGNEAAAGNPADLSAVKNTFGYRIDSSTFNQYTLQVSARREGRLKWFRAYRINCALLTLEILVKIRSGKLK
ncbi:unnamed protein product [Neospora caninum Liverpool]|uniref:Transmembrane protein n=1 Tax=Neospora caninum (strain Liverpool) TaxID=572307 RepID=F0VEV3_NEOCL|nr:uncharacterized protein NCLIV_020340 [Neospora caninum Liverpool]CBZ52247.1 unnamed protein product [Neospora caninum Liverpool]|eukprot:XP_003882279.1 uncharacterized protein NCLIV_020340 [Neospora caninum Liverpool]